MANDRRNDRDEKQVEPPAKGEQATNDAGVSPKEPADVEKVKDDEWMDDRFQATDN